MSQWGLWDDEISKSMLVSLAGAYSRRKEFEMRMLAKALYGSTPQKTDEVSADSFLAMTGIHL